MEVKIAKDNKNGEDWTDQGKNNSNRRDFHEGEWE